MDSLTVRGHGDGGVMTDAPWRMPLWEPLLFISGVSRLGLARFLLADHFADGYRGSHEEREPVKEYMCTMCAL